MSIRKASRTSSAIIATVGWAGAAGAHPGSHSHMSAGEILEHTTVPWHALPLVALAAIGIAFLVVRQRRGEKAEAVKARTERS